ncbi:unnamed protein product, partial [Adineta ricciae]
DITFGDSINSFISHYIPVHYETPSLFDTQVTELVSGCLFKTPHNDYIQPAELYLDIPYDSSSSLGDYFKTTIIFDVAKAAQVDPTRIMYLFLQAYYDVIQQKTITLVKVSLLPSATAEVSDATVRMMVDTLVNNQLDTSSVLYTSTKFLKYLRNNLTQKSNVELGLLTSTSITTTTTTTTASDPIDLVFSSTTSPEPASNETASIPSSKCSVLSTNSKSSTLNFIFFNGAESNIYSSNRLYRTRLNTGDRSANIIAISEIYDPSSGTWSVTGSLAQGREQHAATVLKSGKVLVTGGEGLTGYTNHSEIYDPLTGQWSSAG